jgi:hypothetical protein
MYRLYSLRVRRPVHLAVQVIQSLQAGVLQSIPVSGCLKAEDRTRDYLSLRLSGLNTLTRVFLR